MKYKAIDTAFVTALKSIRRYSTFTDAVLTIFGEFYNREESKAILIYLVKYLPLTPDEQDIVLESWGLLIGYTEIDSVTDRKEQYIRSTGYNGNQEPYDMYKRDHISKDAMRKAKNSLGKHEDRLYARMDREFSISINSPDDINAFIRAALNSYYDKTNEIALIPLPSFHMSKESRSGNYMSRNIQFIGRDDILKQLFDNFFIAENPMHIQTLYGMAGVGKTSIALEYTHRYRGYYGLVWWIDASSEESLITSCVNLLKRKNIEDYTPDNPISILNCFFELIEGMANRLIVIDNANIFDENSVFADKFRKEFPTYRGHTLVTTLNSKAENWMNMIHVDLFDADTALQYLYRKTKLAPDENAQLLAKRLGYLPLALDYVGSFIEVQGISYKEYLEKWKRIKTRIFDKKYSERIIRQVFHLTLDKLNETKLAKSAYEFLKQFSCYNATQFNLRKFIRCASLDFYFLYGLRKIEEIYNCAPVFIDMSSDNEVQTKYGYICTNSNGSLSAKTINGPNAGDEVVFMQNSLCDVLFDEDRMDDLVFLLKRYSLIKYEHGLLSIHPMLREIICDELNESEKRRYGSIVDTNRLLYNFALEYEPYDVVQSREHTLLHSRLKEIKSTLSSGKLSKEDTSDLCGEYIGIICELKHYYNESFPDRIILDIGNGRKMIIEKTTSLDKE